ncbi:MAG: hypothetical protein Q8P39_03970 [Candidatus Yanofskybacteria bacterium]|nr:hypothetical protein [Candidatus Yanofskybacteria bacterium]
MEQKYPRALALWEIQGDIVSRQDAFQRCEAGNLQPRLNGSRTRFIVRGTLTQLMEALGPELFAKVEYKKVTESPGLPPRGQPQRRTGRRRFVH